MAEWFSPKFDFMPAHYLARLTFGSRLARPVKSYNNVLLPFSYELWLVILATSFNFAIVFYITHLTYESLFPTQGLHRNEKSKINFLLFTLSKLTEPDPVPWFTTKWSTGRLVTVLWTVWGLFMVMCYNSNLRAHMTSPKYEKSLDTVQDVAENNKVSWLPKHLLALRQSYLEKTNQTDGPLYQISKRASAAGSFFITAEHGGLPPQAIQVKMVTKLYAKYCL